MDLTVTGKKKKKKKKKKKRTRTEEIRDIQFIHALAPTYQHRYFNFLTLTTKDCVFHDLDK